MSGMYDMYPDYARQDSFTLRASTDEMRRWDSYALEDGLAGDTVDVTEARLVATAQRATDDAERPLGFGTAQRLARNLIKAAGVELP